MPTNQSKLLVDTCPQCQGWAVLKSADGQTTCPRCYGFVTSVTLGQNKLFFKVPSLISFGEIRKGRIIEIVRNSILVFIAFLTFVLAYQIIITSPSTESLLSPFVTSGGLTNYFWLLVLIDCYSIYLFSIRQTPIYSLKDLTLNHKLPKKNDSVDLQLFLSEEAKKLIANALENTEKQRLSTLTNEILFMTLLENQKVQLIFARLQLPPQQIANSLKELFSSLPKEDISANVVIISPQVRETLMSSLNEAINLNFEYVDVEDILLAFLKSSNSLSAALTDLNFTYEIVKPVALWVNEEQENRRAWAFWRKSSRRRSKTNVNQAWTSFP